MKTMKLKRKALSRYPWRTLAEGTGGAGYTIQTDGPTYMSLGLSSDTHAYSLELDTEAVKDLIVDCEEFLKQVDETWDT